MTTELILRLERQSTTKPRQPTKLWFDQNRNLCETAAWAIKHLRAFLREDLSHDYGDEEVEEILDEIEAGDHA